MRWRATVARSDRTINEVELERFGRAAEVLPAEDELVDGEEAAEELSVAEGESVVDGPQSTAGGGA